MYATQNSTAQRSTIHTIHTIQYSTAKHNTAQHNIAQHRRAIQHKLGKHGKAQCRAAENIFSRLNTPCPKNNRIKLNQSNVESYKYGNAQ